VNKVGVNINTASASLLQYVSGINASLARKLVKYRDEKGKIASREDLTTVPGMGPKSFEQCAGFLKIPESSDPLDNTWVHPENYEIARLIRDTITVTGNLNAAEAAQLKEKYGVGDTTIKDIVDELKKPNRDPRDEYPKPIMHKGVLTFDDVSEGMVITGKIKNVVDFGAFVDLGIKETALVHISEMSDHFVKDPLEAVKVGDVLEFHILSLDRDRKRISLTRKTNPGSCPGQDPKQGPVQGAGQSPGQSAGTAADKHGEKGKQAKRVLVKKAEAGAGPGGGVRTDRATRTGGATQTHDTAHGAGQRDGAGPRRGAPDGAGNRGGQGSFDRNNRDDDGTMYNPFAEAFKKMQEKKGKR
jgi:uncharacterized protein